MTLFHKTTPLAASLGLLLCPTLAQAESTTPVAKGETQQQLSIISTTKVSPTRVDITLSQNRKLSVDFYSNEIFRLFRDDQGGDLRSPEAKPPAQILVDHPRADLTSLTLTNTEETVTIATDAIRLELDRATSLMKLVRLSDNKVIMNQLEALTLSDKQVSLTLEEQNEEYFFGGGVQNGRFSHKGKIIAIENQNSWTDGGVASPNPYFWSTRGYGIMWHTFKKGRYDFGATDQGKVALTHDTNYLDLFIMAGESPSDLLGRYFQLTGKPILLPKFGFYLGHLNAYNRDFWKEDEKGILFEDGKRYKESQKDNGGIKETLNGEKDNYQFSARAVIDRYNDADMPLGWLLPNDGYGAGYGQTDSLDGNIQNLRELGDYARERGVEIGLWTQSDLHPKEGVEPLLQRDIVKEVRDAGVRVLKTDVAWVGPGYSFGLNGIADAANIIAKEGDDARPFIITLDGWAGTQRYGGVWTGDQTGGKWEYIRFHIPTYLGAGLSGMSNICSDMDGIFGGKNPIINARDYQWKTFTSMELNMDGWGANPKYPQALGEPATSINRWYLKLKAELMPYSYSIAREAVDGLPMVRAMFLAEPNSYTLGAATQYQFLYGPSFLVAPIYQDTRMEENGDDIRNNIYLPQGLWADYFTGQVYEGGRIINELESPLWKLPVFVKLGAIIPKANPHNNVAELDSSRRIYEFYPHGESSFTEYDDDGRSNAYTKGEGVHTLIQSKLEGKLATINIKPTKGKFKGFDPLKSTELQINLTSKPKTVTAKLNAKDVQLKEVKDLQAFTNGDNVYFYEAAPNLNQFATPESELAKVQAIKNPVLHVKLAKADTTKTEISVTVDGFSFNTASHLLASSGSLATPKATVTEENTQPYSLTPSWEKVANADYYEIEFDGMNYSTIQSNSFLIEDLQPKTQYALKVRAINRDGSSSWQEITATTKANPYQYALKDVLVESTVPDQGKSKIQNLFDHDLKSGWHTKWGQKAVPFEFVVDFQSVNTLEKLQYIPRDDAGNGTITKGSISYSLDGQSWTKATDINWEPNADLKEFVFENPVTAAYLRVEVTEAKGNFGSGSEFFIFKVPGSASYIPGDINEDKKIDNNDLTSYDNYTGLRKGDSDFDGYIIKGDVNKNGLIDALDISHVATKLDGGINRKAKSEPLSGTVELKANKKNFKAGETVEITVTGSDLVSVNALSFALPYDPKQYEFVSLTPAGMEKMKEFTKNRTHTNGSRALYPTFVNIGEAPKLNGSKTLFTIKLKAKQDLTYDLKAIDGFLVDPKLRFKQF
ncbi:TIM-barrel domain-containing protein [Rubritalea tangerina]|uniref:TIM-barrel domain-containing protein n=1 Tax=Rubritalea tangerina TaxID=430798 RepID=A0ABW4Z697_9BACT